MEERIRIENPRAGGCVRGVLENQRLPLQGLGIGNKPFNSLRLSFAMTITREIIGTGHTRRGEPTRRFTLRIHPVSAPQPRVSHC